VLRNEYLGLRKNLILKAQLKGRLRLSDAERARLGAIAIDWGVGSRRGSGMRPLPDNHPGLVPRLVARKFDGSMERPNLGPTADRAEK